jgi:hypothetical protein
MYIPKVKMLRETKYGLFVDTEHTSPSVAVSSKEEDKGSVFFNAENFGIYCTSQQTSFAIASPMFSPSSVQSKWDLKHESAYLLIAITTHLHLIIGECSQQQYQSLKDWVEKANQLTSPASLKQTPEQVNQKDIKDILITCPDCDCTFDLGSM